MTISFETSARNNKTFKYTTLIFSGLALLTCISTYWTGLNGPLVIDDLTNLNYLLKKDITLAEILSRLFSKSGQLGRPVSMFSFSVNALLSQDIFYWKLTNLVIHLLCGLVIYFLIEKVIYFAARQNQSVSSNLLALTVTLIWLLHPLHVSTVLYTVQRMTQLSALFLLLATLCYLTASNKKLNSLPYLRYQVLAWGLFFPLAVFSKESGILLPLFVLLLELFLIRRQQISSKQLSMIMLTLCFVAVLLFLFKKDVILAAYGGRNFTMSERLLTETRVIFSYLSMLIIPAQSNMGFLHDDILISKNFLNPPTTFASSLGIIFLIGLAFYLRRKQPLISFGILFFFLGHLLESTIFSLELMFEHRNYLPSLGIFLAVVTFVNLAIESRYIQTTLALSLLLLLSFSTWLRADSWSDPLRFYYDLERFKPKSERLAAFLSEQALQSGNYERARNKLNLFDTPGAKIKRLYIDCLEKKSLADQQLSINASSPWLLDNFAIMGVIDIANLGLDGNCSFSFNTFLSWLDDLLKQKIATGSNRQMVMMYKSHYLWRLGKHDEAIAFIKKAYDIDKTNPIPILLGCEWSIDKNMVNATEICPMSLTVAGKSAYLYDELMARVKKRYVNFLENQEK